MGEAARRAALGIGPRANQIQITPEMMQNAKQKICECGSPFFQHGVSVFTLSALVSPTGQELNINVPVMICMNCKKAMVKECENS